MRAPVLCILLAMGVAANAADVHVDSANQTGVTNGSTLRPYTSVPAAVAAANDGDRVLIAKGTYNGTVRVEGKTLSLIGGFAGGSTGSYAANSSGDFTTQHAAAFPTTIVASPNDAAVLLLEAGASRVESLTLTGGTGARPDKFRVQGGGIYAAGGTPTIRACRIHDNDINGEIRSFGGGIHGENAHLTIRDCTIENNSAGRGAGISISGGTVLIAGNRVSNNIGTDDHGGGIYAFSPNITIERNDIIGNEIGRALGYGWGGGVIIFNVGANATLRHNRIGYNYSPSRGPGVFIDEGATATMEHCVIFKNPSDPDAGVGAVYVDPGDETSPSHLTMRHCTIYGHADENATLGGNGLFVEQYCTTTVENSIFWGNGGDSIWYPEGAATVIVAYTNTEESFPGAGNLRLDPLFANVSMDDYHLRSTAGRFLAPGSWAFDAASSPCIDAANPLSPFANEPQGNGGRANMGAYGNTAEASRSSLPDFGSGSGYLLR